jgi:hypothetical protein
LARRLTLTAPLYYGFVIEGIAGAELGVRGRVKASFAKDGKLSGRSTRPRAARPAMKLGRG